MECFVPYGEKRQITLPDGTTAWINSSTILVYPNEFSGNTRTVFLNGEARFDVSKDPQKPFIVKTTFLDIEALGTVFNVSSYLDNFYTVATLEEGSIKVSLFDMNEPDIILNPNQQILYQHNSKDIEITQVEAENMGLWRTGELYFKGASFSHIMKSFERHFNVEIQYNPAKFKSQRITVRFSPEENIDDALIVLQAIIPNFKYEKCNNKIIIN